MKDSKSENKFPNLQRRCDSFGVRKSLNKELEALGISEQRDGVIDGHSSSLVAMSEEDTGSAARPIYAEGNVHHHVKGLKRAMNS